MRYILALLAVATVACGSTNPPVCIPGAQVACACAGGGQGAQVCAADGAAYGSCVCLDGGGADVAPADSGSGIDAPPIDVQGIDVPREDVPAADLGVDVSPDAGDDGPRADAGAVDAAAADAGAADAGVDVVALDAPSDAHDAALGADVPTCDASLATDPANCGACGNACVTGSRCTGGLCTGALIGGLGGPSGYGLAENCLPPIDDGASGLIDLSAAFPSGLRFYNNTYTGVFVGANGVISFARPSTGYRSVAFPSSREPLIAPWWGDVDTRGGGQPVVNSICHAFRGSQLVVTWHNVGRFAQRVDRLNSFQVVIASRAEVESGAFDVELRYSRCEWAAGEAADNAPAQAGFDAGDRMNFLALPGSRTSAVLNLCTTSNVNMPGVWRFEVRAAGITAGH